MSAWHAFVDSGSFRWFAKRGPGRPIFRSRAYRRMRLERNRVLAARAVRDDPERFADVRTFCFFVGHNKSGTSLLGGLLDAHPNVALADEADALQYVEAGLARDAIFQLMVRGARTEARKGRVTARRLGPYSYWVPGQWQGRTTRTLVVGDSTSGSSTRRLCARPDLLDRLQTLTGGVDLRIIQVIRNPFDPISAMMVRSGRSMSNAVAHYFSACEALVDIRSRVDPGVLMAVRYEDVVANASAMLRQACEFVGVAPDAEYVRACTSIVRLHPERSRELVPWAAAGIDEVEQRIADFDFLEGYSYAS